MQYRKLGRQNLRISAMSVGGHLDWGISMGLEEVEPILVAAYEAGVNFFDSAERYGNGACERIIGQVIKRQAWDRDSLILGSKVNPRGTESARGSQVGLSRKRLIDACEASLRRYGVDYLDLFLLHRPDPDSDSEEIVRTMNALIQQGKICYWGTSTFEPETITAYYRIADQLGMEGPHLEQCIHNLIANAPVRNRYRPFIQERGMGITAYMPLHSGLLTDKYAHGIPAGSKADTQEWIRNNYEKFEPTIAQWRALAADLGISTASLAIAWCLKEVDVSSVIVGATTLEHVQRNLTAFEALPLMTDAVLQRCAEIATTLPR